MSLINELTYDSLLQVYQNNKESIEDITLQYLHLLSFLTHTVEISREDFVNKVMEISKIGDIVVCYSIDVQTGKVNIVGSGTIVYEPKIIRGCKYVGHIEDIVVHSDYRSHGIAKNILHLLVEKAKQNNCYKTILDCKPELVAFYQRNGFLENGNQMTMYF
uniref:N-acetyltransferase domain-containing protein n=1 Tax=viral metagenome TaxID=1070528 RepID=A0A6C0E246_9ZZZZ